MTTQTTQSASDLQSKVKELTDEVERLKEELERAKRTPTRERLPHTRRSITHKFSVAGHEGYITVGMYPDGRPAELFITMAKEGSTIRGLMDSVGILASMALQYGVPVQALANKLSHSRFEPWGHTNNPDIRMAKSLIDYVFRWLGQHFGTSEESLAAVSFPSQERDHVQEREISDGVAAPSLSPEAPG